MIQGKILTNLVTTYFEHTITAQRQQFLHDRQGAYKVTLWHVNK